MLFSSMIKESYMNTFTKILTRLLIIIGWFVQAFLSFALLALISIGFGFLFSTKLRYLAINNTGIHSSFSYVLITLILAVGILVSLILIVHYLKAFASNIFNSLFFVQSNLDVLRKTLIYTSVFFVLQCLSDVLGSLTHNTGISSIFTDSISSVFYLFIFWATIYLFYITFKYGLKVQQDNNSVI